VSAHWTIARSPSHRWQHCCVRSIALTTLGSEESDNQVHWRSTRRASTNATHSRLGYKGQLSQYHDWVRDLSAGCQQRFPCVAMRHTTSRCPAASLNRADVVPGEAAEGLVTWCGWHGMQGSGVQIPQLHQARCISRSPASGVDTVLSGSSAAPATAGWCGVPTWARLRGRQRPAPSRSRTCRQTPPEQP
jgi:hypothetical protein